MHCLLFGLACDEDKFNSFINRTHYPFSMAHYLFETELLSELQNYYKIDHNYIIQNEEYDKKNIIIKSQEKWIDKKIKTKYLGFINIPIIKHISIFISTCQRIHDFNNKGFDYFLLSTINYVPVALATQLMSHIYNKKNILIVTDCTVGNAYKDKSKNVVIAYVRKIYKYIAHVTENNYGAYILFSEHLNQIVNSANRPYCIMEGLFNSQNLDLSTIKKRDVFTILYAGSLMENFGIQNLIEAFRLIEDKDLELLIAGDGPYKEALCHMASGDSRIHFTGYIEHDKLFYMEKEVSLLINTRNPEEDYTKYSFPSKTFEYLASGTPFLSTRLKCYGKEYNNVIKFIETNEPNDIAKAICHVKQMDSKRLAEDGKNAQKFVLTQKSTESQILKIYQFIQQLYEECR